MSDVEHSRLPNVLISILGSLILAIQIYILRIVDDVHDRQIERYKYITIIENHVQRIADHELRLRVLEKGIYSESHDSNLGG